MAPTQTPPDASRPRGRTGLAVAIIVVGLVGLLAAAVFGLRYWRQNSVEGIASGVIAGFSSELPKDYGNGLVLERVVLEGRNIVLVIRSTRLSLDAAARNPARFEQARTDEEALMRPLCDVPEVRQVLGQGLQITRRYVDTSDRLFFELSLSAQDCG